jgi:4'-phosphopantetheinyl transferase
MATSGPWSLPPISLALPDEELHVWRASLPTGALAQRFHAFLSPEEKERAGKFLVAHAREQFIASRGILRELLSAYVGKPPADISLTYGPYGKPSLPSPANALSLRFNVSHSHGYGVFAFARKREVGIDVEQIRPEVATEEISARFFSAAEIAELGTLPVELRGQGFFKCWTRKEAYLKAQGLGLRIPLESFSVRIKTDEAQQISEGDSLPWTLYSFEPEAGFVGAVAAQGRDWRLQYFDWRVPPG